LKRAIAIVNESGIEDARRLAREEADMALSSLKGLPEGEAKASLVAMVEYVLERIY
jgi:all-trans-nonaprenyl-diphosphate synthase